jgi:hypothetical protein
MINNFKEPIKKIVKKPTPTIKKEKRDYLAIFGSYLGLILN